MHDDTFIWIGGAVLPAHAARVPVLDRGFLYGDSVFEVTRTVNKAPLLFAEHLDRLARSAARVGHDVPRRELIEAACVATIAATAAAECYLRIIVTRGEGPLELDPAAAGAPRLVVIAKPLTLPAAALYERGVMLRTVAERRNAPGHVPPEVKSSNYLPSVLALRSAKERGGYEALMCDLDGYVCEGASSNFFVRIGNTLHTPPLALGILPGVTRAAVLPLCRDIEVEVVESRFRVTEIETADEAFMTSSIRGILPVTGMNDLRIGDGEPGAVTRRLMDAYAARYLDRKSSASPTRNSSSISPT